MELLVDGRMMSDQLRDKTVLVVEEEPLLRGTEVKALSDLGFEEIIEATYTGQALNILKRGGIDLVISSWSAPKVGGITLLQQVRNNPSIFTTLFVLTAEALTNTQVIQAGEAGVSEIILLPLRLETLRIKLGQLFDSQENRQRALIAAKMREGLDLMSLGMWEEAIDKFRMVVEVSENAEVYYNLGYIKTAQELYQEALVYFRRATEIDNAFAQAFQQMAVCFRKIGRTDRAEEYLQRAADLYMEKGADDIAEELLQEVLKLNPDTINVFNTLGIIYRRRGEPDQALQQYRRALKVDPEDVNILYNMARVHADVSDFRMAVKILNKVLAVRPDFNEAQRLYKICRTKATEE